MSAVWPTPRRGQANRLEPTSTLDPRLRRTYLQEWRLRAAQWRALLIARAIFGSEASTSLGGHPWTQRFNGLVHLDVPFHGLERHMDCERRFLAAVGFDPVLRAVSLVFVFNPVPTVGADELPSIGGPVRRTSP